MSTQKSMGMFTTFFARSEPDTELYLSEQGPEMEHWVKSHLVAILYSSARQVLLGGILTIAMLAGVLLSRYNMWGILAWFSVGLIVAICRFVLSHQYTVNPERYSPEKWLYMWRLTAFTSGMLFALVAFLYMEGDPILQVMLICAVIGPVSATVSFYACDLRTYRYFLFPPVTVLLAQLLVAEGQTYIALAALLTFLLILLLNSAWQVNRMIVENVRLNYSLQYRATHDALVGLLNRSEFENIYANRNSLSNRPQSLLFIDLDDFKLLNDTLGHQDGDEMLVKVGEIIRQAVRRNDAAARLGGDEFVVLLSNCSKGDSERVAKNILDKIQQSQLNLPPEVPRVGASIGVGYTENGYVRFKDMLAAADKACYEAKRAGKAQVSIIEIEKD